MAAATDSSVTSPSARAACTASVTASATRSGATPAAKAARRQRASSSCSSSAAMTSSGEASSSGGSVSSGVSGSPGFSGSGSSGWSGSSSPAGSSSAGAAASGVVPFCLSGAAGPVPAWPQALRRAFFSVFLRMRSPFRPFRAVQCSPAGSSCGAGGHKKSTMPMSPCFCRVFRVRPSVRRGFALPRPASRRRPGCRPTARPPGPPRS